MATIGLRDVFAAKATIAEDGRVTYGTPFRVAKAIKAELSVELNEAELYGDDGLDDQIREFKQGAITLNTTDLNDGVLNAFQGRDVDSDGVNYSNVANEFPYFAIGFRAKKAKPKGYYRYIWLYLVQFAPPKETYETKGESITYNTPEIEGTIIADESGDWKADKVMLPTDPIATEWFNGVRGRTTLPGAAASLSALEIGALTLAPAFDAGRAFYTADTTNATNTIAATPATEGATVTLTVNGATIANGAAATWAAGQNTVEITVESGADARNYLVLVTKA